MTEYTDGKRKWRNRYYATYGRPCGYYDLGGLSTLINVPDEEDLFPLTAEQWKLRMDGNQMLSKAVIDGVWQDYAQVVPLHLSARSHLEGAQNYVLKQFCALGKPIPQAWIDYQKALISIVNGIDTTSTELPTRPPDAQ